MRSGSTRKLQAQIMYCHLAIVSGTDSLWQALWAYRRALQADKMHGIAALGMASLATSGHWSVPSSTEASCQACGSDAGRAQVALSPDLAQRGGVGGDQGHAPDALRWLVTSLPSLTLPSSDRALLGLAGLLCWSLRQLQRCLGDVLLPVTSVMHRWQRLGELSSREHLVPLAG